MSKRKDFTNMDMATEVVCNVLEKELDVIADGKRKHVSQKIIEGLVSAGYQIVSVDSKNKLIDNQEEFIKLHKYFCQFNNSDRYLDVIQNEKDPGMKQYVSCYKETFLDKKLKRLKEETRDVDVDNPYIGDLLVCLGRHHYAKNEHIDKY